MKAITGLIGLAMSSENELLRERQARASEAEGRAAAAGIETKLGNHSFRATGITAYLKNGGTLEKAAAMANHASTRTTQLYDRRRDQVSLDEVERIVI
jgi:integrase